MRQHSADRATPRTGRGHGKGHGKGGGRRHRLFDYGELRLLILMMIEEQPRHGYELIKLIESRFDGSYSPSPGVIYPTLSWLEDMGYVRISPDGAGRKCSEITPEGVAFLTANRAAGAELLTRKPPMGREGAPAEILAAMDRLKAALRARFGAAAQDATEVARVAEQIATLADQLAAAPSASPEAEPAVLIRHRYETRRRDLTVREARYLTPHMIRVVLEGEDLHDFVSLGADDHIKLFLPGTGTEPEMRDYTPRAYDTEARTLTLDFAVHDAGPATAWAMAAQPGDSLSIGGPRGSSVIAPVFDWYLLIGDETALPAIGRKVEELGVGVEAITLVAVPEPADQQPFDSAAQVTAHWVHRPVQRASDPAPLIAALADIALPAGKGFVFIAAEAAVARALKSEILARGHRKDWMKAAGYWIDGQVAASDKSLD